MLDELKELKITEGAGGGGKSGGGGGSEADDTLVTNEVIKVLNLLGEGEVNLYTGDGRSILLNSVPLQNPDLSYNFGGYNQATSSASLYTGTGATYYEYRNGAPSQLPMTNPAFPSAASVVSVNAQFTGGTGVVYTGATPYTWPYGQVTERGGSVSYTGIPPNPVIYGVSSALVDYCVVAIQFPDGLENVDSGGNITGDQVEIAIDIKPHSSSTWVNAIDRIINDKASSAAIIQFQVNNPSPGNLWDIRCRRITPDNASSTRKNQCFLYTVEEVQQVTLPYNGIAYCGLALDAATIGGSNASIPVMSFLVSRGPIKIPSNFNPANNTFSSSTWDGTWTTGVTDDPAWCLYDLLYNPQYGCGLYGITESMIDKYSFYNASVFNNQQVPSGVTGTTEPRFTFNAPLVNRQDMLVTLNQVAGMMNATLGMTAGLIELFQDRPATSQYLITKANCVVSDPKNPIYFTRKSTALTNRTTSVNVTFTDSTDPRFLPRTTSVADATGLARYGYLPYDLAAFGATTEGQAQRAGRYWLYQNLYCTEEIEYQTGLQGLLSNINDVIDVYDDDYAGRAFSGRIVSATTNTVTLDQPVIIDSGVTSKVSVWLQDGTTYETHVITNSAGTYSTLNISGTWSVIPTQYCVYGVQSAVAPEQFKITDIKIDGVSKIASITAQKYDPNNYTYVDSGVSIPQPTYTQPVLVAPTVPTNLVATPSQYINPVNGQLAYNVTVSWIPPDGQNVAYILKWRKNGGQYTTLAQMRNTSYELTNITDGSFTFLVYSVNLQGNQSAPAVVSYTLNTAGGSASSTLSEITGLSVTGGGTTWTGFDMSIAWTNPTANQGLLKDFVVTFKTTGGTLLRTVVVPGVVGGATQSYLYTFAMNQADGGPNRSIAVTVQGRDSSNNTTTGDTATLTNVAPAVPLNISASPGLQSCLVTWTPETNIDVAGYIVWYSTTSGFTPSSANAVDCGNTAIASLNGLSKSTTYYFIVAAYDVFGKSLSGTGLNLSSQLSFATPSNIGIASGSTLPSSGMVAGDTFYDTANNTLYTYNGSAWIPAGIISVATLPASGAVGQVVLLTTNNVLYQWNGSSWQPVSVPAGSVTGQLTASQILSLTAAQLTGQITTTQITNNAITTPLISAGAVVSASIAANSILGSNIAGSTITGTNIVGGTITGSLIAANTINTSNLVAGCITAATIAAGAVTTSALAAGAVTAATIASNTITASQIQAGSITAGCLNVATLSAISANIGTVTAGTISNSSGTNVINLSATGSTPFISTPGLTILAGGAATFSGAISGAIVYTSNIVTGNITTATINNNAVSTTVASTIGSYGSNTTFTSGAYTYLTSVAFAGDTTPRQTIITMSMDVTVSGSASSFVSCKIVRLNNSVLTTLWEGLSDAGNSSKTYAQIKGTVVIVDTTPTNGLTNTYEMQLYGTGGTNYYYNTCTITGLEIKR